MNKAAYISVFEAVILKTTHWELKRIVGLFWVVSGQFWVVSDSFHIVFSAASGRNWVVLCRPIELSSIEDNPEMTRVVGRSRSSRFSFHIVFSVVQGRLTLLKRYELT